MDTITMITTIPPKNVHLENVKVVLFAVEWDTDGVPLSQTRELAQGDLQARMVGVMMVKVEGSTVDLVCYE